MIRYAHVSRHVSTRLPEGMHSPKIPSFTLEQQRAQKWHLGKSLTRRGAHVAHAGWQSFFPALRVSRVVRDPGPLEHKALPLPWASL